MSRVSVRLPTNWMRWPSCAPNVTPVIARLLGMSDVPQTRRMACAIVANAMIFHQRIAGMHQEVKPLHLVCGPNVANPQREALAAWEDILKINYWLLPERSPR